MAPKRMGVDFVVGARLDKESFDLARKQAIAAMSEMSAEMGQYMGKFDKVLDEGFKGFKAFKSLTTFVATNNKEIAASFDLLGKSAPKLKLAGESLSYMAMGMKDFNAISKQGLTAFKTLTIGSGELAVGLKDLGKVDLSKTSAKLAELSNLTSKLDPKTASKFKELAKGVSSLTTAFASLPSGTDIGGKVDAIKGMSEGTIGSLFKNINEIKAKSLEVKDFKVTGKSTVGGFGGGLDDNDKQPVIGKPDDEDITTKTLSKIFTIATFLFQPWLAQQREESNADAFMSQKEGGGGFGGFPYLGNKTSTLKDIMVGMREEYSPEKGSFSIADSAALLMSYSNVARNNRNMFNVGSTSEEGVAGNKGLIASQAGEYKQSVRNYQTNLGMDLNSSLNITAIIAKNTDISTTKLESLSKSLIGISRASGMGAEGLTAIVPQMVNFAIVTGQLGDKFEAAATGYAKASGMLISRGLSSSQTTSFLNAPYSGDEKSMLLSIAAGVNDTDDEVSATKKRLGFQGRMQGHLTVRGTGHDRQLNPYMFNKGVEAGILDPNFSMAASYKALHGRPDTDEAIKEAKFTQATISLDENVRSIKSAIGGTIEGLSAFDGGLAAASKYLFTFATGIPLPTVVGHPGTLGADVAASGEAATSRATSTKLSSLLQAGIKVAAGEFGLGSPTSTERPFNGIPSKHNPDALGEVNAADFSVKGKLGNLTGQDKIDAGNRLAAAVNSKLPQGVKALIEWDGQRNANGSRAHGDNLHIQTMGKAHTFMAGAVQTIHETLTAATTQANINKELTTTLTKLNASIDQTKAASGPVNIETASKTLVHAAQLLSLAVQKMIANNALISDGSTQAIAMGRS